MSARLPDELSVGFDTIDGQHRDLYQRMDAAIAAAAAGDVALTRAAVTVLGDSFTAHFAAEEQFMNEALYPERGRHKSAHDLFLADFAQLTRELETFGITPLVHDWVCTRVPEWTGFHIRVNDVPLGRFLAAKRFRPGAAAQRAAKPRVS